MGRFEEVTDEALLEKIKAQMGSEGGVAAPEVSPPTHFGMEEVVDEDLVLKIKQQIDSPQEQGIPAFEPPSAPTPFDDFLSESKEDLQKREAKIMDTWTREESGEELPFDAYFKVGGDVAGGFFDVVGNALSLSATGWGMAMPPSVKDSAKNAISEGAAWVAKSPNAQAGLEALQGGIEKYQVWAAANPSDARRLGAAVNIGSFFSPVKATASVPVLPNKATIAQKISGWVKAKAEKQERSVSDAKAKDLVLPEKKDPSNSREVAGTIPFTSKTVRVETPAEREVIDEVMKLGIPKNKSYQGSYDNIGDAIEDKALKLDARLDKSDAVITLAESTDAIIEATSKLSGGAHPLINSSALEKSIKEVTAIAVSVLKDFPQTPKGVLQARREIDIQMKKYKSANDAFPTETQTALGLANQEMRLALNDLVDIAVPDAAVKAGLKSQSLLFRAQFGVLPKAEKEAAATLGRAWANVQRVTGVHAPSTPVAIAVLGSTALGILPQLIGGLTVAAGGTMVYKGVTSSQLKRFIAETIAKTDKAIKVATNPAMVKQLKLDRAALLEMAELYPTEKTEKGSKQPIITPSLPAPQQPNVAPPEATQVPQQQSAAPSLQGKSPEELRQILSDNKTKRDALYAQYGVQR